MNSQLSIEDLKEILAIMEDMHREAKSGNWSVLTRLDDRRRHLLGYIDTSVSANSPTHHPEKTETVRTSPKSDRILSTRPTTAILHGAKIEYKALCDHIIKLDKAIFHTVQEARQNLLNENRSLNAQVTAKNKYAQVCSSQETSFG